MICFELALEDVILIRDALKLLAQGSADDSRLDALRLLGKLDTRIKVESVIMERT